MKYLIWLVIALAVIVWIQRAKKSLTGGASPAPGGRKPGAGFRRQRKEPPEAIVQCAHCGIHFPVSEAVTNTAGLVFCSDEHLRLASA